MNPEQFSVISTWASDYMDTNPNTHKIPLIKAIREEFGLNLRDAKRVADQFDVQFPNYQVHRDYRVPARLAMPSPHGASDVNDETPNDVLQQLIEKVQDLEAEIRDLKDQGAELDDRVTRLEDSCDEV